MARARDYEVAREQHEHREARHYKPADLTGACAADCGTAVPAALTTAGVGLHPTCGDVADLVATDHARQLTERTTQP